MIALCRCWDVCGCAVRLGRGADHLSARARHRLQFLHVLQPHAGPLEIAKEAAEGFAGGAAEKQEATGARSGQQ